MKLTKEKLRKIIREEMLLLEMFDTGSAGDDAGGETVAQKKKKCQEAGGKWVGEDPSGRYGHCSKPIGELQQLDATEPEAVQQPAGTPNPQAAQAAGVPTSPGQGDAQAGKKPAQKQASSVAAIVKLLPSVKFSDAYAQLLDAVIDHASSEHLEQYQSAVHRTLKAAREKILNITQGK